MGPGEYAKVGGIALSVLIPTRDRADYLAVTLRSLREQFGGEVIVVVDGPDDPATARVTADHGARLEVVGAHRGANAARNLAFRLASGDLLGLLDDDVALWPGWREALEGAAAAHPDVGAFGGPIRPVLEGPAPRGCGRPQDAPMTALDLGPADREAEFVWSANMAIRRSALEAVGPFAETIRDSGEEEEWLRRLHAAGGTVRYLAAAGVDHRRAGDDARLGALVRVAYHRGRAGRRYDEDKGTAPPMRRELRVLAGTLWHVAAHRCPAGLVPVARTVGRIRAALGVPRPKR